ncbi:restriction endonuclease subunit S [Vibrio splendidus]|uniref:restriction endonuclease subunit S n=1 Tax=Vibrio splendidus TaxID=29497 RepID=UPI000D3642C1|nr:restriction endonuclease subunit S [Vibrio splendidus]PTO79142.1 hypothetical protein CWN93_18870 [Vibrio splendidus]
MMLHSHPYDSYKTAESEWSKSIPSEWQEKRVKDLFRLVTDAAPAGNDYELLSLFAGIGVKPRKDMEARGNKASSTDGYWVVKKSDIVVNKLLAWMGSVGISEYDGVTSPAYDVLRKVQPDIEPRYFSYLFRTETAKKIFRKNSRGIMDMRLRLYFDKLGAITVPVPSYEEQVSISNYLDFKTKQIDSKKMLLQKKIESYKKLKENLTFNTVVYGIRKNCPLEDSGYVWAGEKPKHWGVKRLKELGETIMGQSPASSSYVDEGEGEPFLQGNAEFGADHPKEKVWCSDVKKYSSEGDILVSVRAPVGAVNIANKPYGIGRGLCAYRPYGDQRYHLYLMKSLCRYFNSIATGSTYVAISLQDIRNTLVPNPPLHEQLEISNYLDFSIKSLDDITKNLESQVSKLSDLRIAVVNDAISGRIKIPNDSYKSGGEA